MQETKKGSFLFGVDKVDSGGSCRNIFVHGALRVGGKRVIVFTLLHIW